MNNPHSIVMEFSPLIYNLHLDDLSLAFAGEHWADLKKSDLSDEVIKAAQVFSVRPCDIPAMLGFNPDQVTSALCFPYLNTDFFRLKIFPAYIKDGSLVKYLQQKNSGSHLYFPHGVDAAFQDSRIPLSIVEGEKKTMRVSQEGVLCIGIGGVNNWNLKGTQRLIPDFDLIEWRNREVTILPDGDVLTNFNVKRGAVLLGRELEKREAVVSIGLIPKVVANA